MPKANAAIPEFIEHHLDIIESEVHELRHLIKKSISTPKVRKSPNILRGILSGVKVDDRDIEQAKRSLFKNIKK